jgi:hypothetical protein
MEKNGWWYNPQSEFLAFISGELRWGWLGNGRWFHDKLAKDNSFSEHQRAPKEMVIERAQKELLKRGYVKDVVVTSRHKGIKVKLKYGLSLHESLLNYLMNYGEFWGNGTERLHALIMCNGLWADFDNHAPKLESNELLIKCL